MYIVLQLFAPLICDLVQDHTLHCCKLNINKNKIIIRLKFCKDLLNCFNLFAFNALRHAAESSVPSFSSFTLTVWNACQKKETSLKPHANLYDNRHFLKFQIM